MWIWHLYFMQFCKMLYWLFLSWSWQFLRCTPKSFWDNRNLVYNLLTYYLEKSKPEFSSCKMLTRGALQEGTPYENISILNHFTNFKYPKSLCFIPSEYCVKPWRLAYISVVIHCVLTPLNFLKTGTMSSYSHKAY